MAMTATEKVLAKASGLESVRAGEVIYPDPEYIIVHEFIHLLERHHNEKFRAYLDKYMPQWQAHKRELNRQPLSHSNWEY